jgi:hypothetical protein
LRQVLDDVEPGLAEVGEAEAFVEEDGEEGDTLDDVILLLIGYLLEEAEVEGALVGLAQDILELTQLLTLRHLPSLEELLHLLVELLLLHLLLRHLILPLALRVVFLAQDVFMKLLQLLGAL